MARITLNEINVGDAVGIAAPNTTLANWRSESINVDADNVRVEGLHRRNFAANAVVTPPTSDQYISAPVGADLVATTTREIVDIGVPQVIGAFTFDSTQLYELMVFGSFQYRDGRHQDAYATYGASPVWNMCLSYSTNWNGTTGTWTVIDETLRKAGFGFQPTATFSVYMQGSISWAHRFSVTLNTTSLYFAFQVWEPRLGIPITIERTTLYAMFAQR